MDARSDFPHRDHFIIGHHSYRSDRIGFARDARRAGQYAAAYQAQKPDVVLMDIRMPGVDGIAATRQIRVLDPAARIVIVSDYDDNQLRDAALAAGACDYTLKDNLPDLVTLLGRLRANREPGINF